MKMIRELHRARVTGYVYASAEEMAQAAADYMEREIIELLKQKEEINIMFSVGISQDLFHKALCKKRTFDWSRINLMLLDEKIGLAQKDPRSAAYRLEAYFRDAGTPFKNGYYFDGANPDPEAECARFAKVLRAHEPDLAFIGIGINGHIALNEPGEGKFDDTVDCKIVKISDRTKLSNLESGSYARMEDVPACGLTITLPRLGEMRRKFTIMPYPEKADSAYEVFCGDIREAMPATYACMHDWTIFLDADSASRIPE